MPIYYTNIFQAYRFAWLGLYFILFSTRLLAQSCPCAPAFAFVRQKTELNYAGFTSKVSAETRGVYETHTALFQQNADTVSTVRACAKHCQEWLKWFNDRHLQVGPNLLVQARRPDSDFSLISLDSQTLLLRLPTMAFQYKPLLDSILQQHKALLETHPYFIIDCRGNAGGSISTWSALKPYLYSGPVVTDGLLYWASEDNAKAMLDHIKPGMPKAQKKYYQKTAKEMKKMPGKFIGTMNARRERTKTILPKPEKVVILVDERSASSTELLLLWATQSTKVTIMGAQTAGVADYGSISTVSVPCHNWILGYPIARSNRVPDGRAIDNVGISPDIRLDAQSGDWIEFARNWFRQ